MGAIEAWTADLGSRGYVWQLFEHFAFPSSFTSGCSGYYKRYTDEVPAGHEHVGGDMMIGLL